MIKVFNVIGGIAVQGGVDHFFVGPIYQLFLQEPIGEVERQGNQHDNADNPTGQREVALEQWWPQPSL
jgi:hypothetical protein